MRVYAKDDAFFVCGWGGSVPPTSLFRRGLNTRRPPHGGVVGILAGLGRKVGWEVESEFLEGHGEVFREGGGEAAGGV